MIEQQDRETADLYVAMIRTLDKSRPNLDADGVSVGESSGQAVGDPVECCAAPDDSR